MVHAEEIESMVHAEEIESMVHADEFQTPNEARYIEQGASRLTMLRRENSI